MPLEILGQIAGLQHRIFQPWVQLGQASQRKIGEDDVPAIGDYPTVCAGFKHKRVVITALVFVQSDGPDKHILNLDHGFRKMVIDKITDGQVLNPLTEIVFRHLYL